MPINLIKIKKRGSASIANSNRTSWKTQTLTPILKILLHKLELLFALFSIKFFQKSSNHENDNKLKLILFQLQILSGLFKLVRIVVSPMNVCHMSFYLPLLCCVECGFCALYSDAAQRISWNRQFVASHYRHYFLYKYHMECSLGFREFFSLPDVLSVASTCDSASILNSAMQMKKTILWRLR